MQFATDGIHKLLDTFLSAEFTVHSQHCVAQVWKLPKHFTMDDLHEALTADAAASARTRKPRDTSQMMPALQVSIS